MINKLFKSKNKLITAEVSPHHLYFCDDDIVDFNTNLKVGPPIRSKSDRKKLIEVSMQHNFKPIFPDLHLCGDNAAMIAMVGLEKFKNKQFDNLDLPADPRLPLDANAKFLKGAGVEL